MTDTETVDELTHHTTAHHAAPEEPGLRLLHHPELARIGGRAACGATWLTIGRHEPRFTGDRGPAAVDDPTISREQVRVRWRPDRGAFEVAPIASARRPVTVIDPARGPTATVLDAPCELPPGTILAIGERVAIGLERGRVRPPGADRLGLVGDSEPMWHLRDEIRAAGQFARPVLVEGPTGAGKELVARALHRAGARPAGPFVAVNCGALPDHLVESTLFGHVKGAFTGAVRDEPGVFVAADGGTLFLDEIGELPRAVQPKLLRVLQEREVVPLGATRGRAVELRVVAATHRDLAAEVAAGRLREDLYHRLAAHVLRVPALADRRFDIPALFVHFFTRLAGDHPSLARFLRADPAAPPPIPLAFLVSLLCQPFPGNVRELENTVERIARANLAPGRFRAPDEPIASTLPPPAPAPARPPPAPAAPPAPAPDRDRDDPRIPVIAATLALAPKTVAKLLGPAQLDALTPVLDTLSSDARARRITEAAADALYTLLADHDFNQSRVAVLLGTSRTTVVKLIADLGLPRAADLDLATIDAARALTGGDLDAAARHLRVSPHALKKRLTLLALARAGDRR